MERRPLSSQHFQIRAQWLASQLNKPRRCTPNLSQSSPHDEPIPPINDTAKTRWRREELGIFDPEVDDVYTFTNRMHQVAEFRGHLLVQFNGSL